LTYSSARSSYNRLYTCVSGHGGLTLQEQFHVRPPPLRAMSKSKLFLFPRNRAFWESVGISPASVKKTNANRRQGIDEYLLKFIKSLGLANVHFLSQQAGIPDPGKLQRGKLPELFLGACDKDTLLYLKEFFKNRLTEIEEAFRKATDVKPTALEGD